MFKEIGEARKVLNEDTERRFIIESADDLADLPSCAVGSRAFSADYTLFFTKDVDGEWIGVA